jgi:hypothetical protein
VNPVPIPYHRAPPRYLVDRRDLMRAATCPNVFVLSSLPQGLAHETPASNFNLLVLRIALADRTRSGFAGLLRAPWAFLGPLSPFGKSVEVVDLVGESSAFSVTESDSSGRFNSPRLPQIARFDEILGKIMHRTPFSVAQSG